jgi:hypothetical protein
VREYCIFLRGRATAVGIVRLTFVELGGGTNSDDCWGPACSGTTPWRFYTASIVQRYFCEGFRNYCPFAWPLRNQCIGSPEYCAVTAAV